MANAERVVAVLRADVRARVDRQLVGERRQRGQHAGAAHDDRVVGLADLVQRDLARRLLGLGLRAVDLRVHDRVRASRGRGRASASGRRRGSRRPARCRAGPTRRRARRSRRTSRSGSRACGPSCRRRPTPISSMARRRRSRSSGERGMRCVTLTSAAVLGRRARASRRRARAAGRRPGRSSRAAARELRLLERVRDPLAVRATSRARRRARPSRNSLPVRARSGGRHASPSGGVRRHAASVGSRGARGWPSVSRLSRSDSIAAGSKRKYERGGSGPQVLDE